MATNNSQEVWNNCLQIIKHNVPQASYKTWFEPIKPVKLQNKVLTIQVPSPYFYEYLEEQYIHLLRRTIRRELGNDAKLEYSFYKGNNGTQNAKSTQSYTVKSSASKTYGNDGSTRETQQNEQQKIRNPFVIPGLKKVKIDPQLNKSYSFENFIEGECNRLARSAAAAVAEKPGATAFNPLLIYGDSGLGKTHLAQAIGLKVKETLSDKTVLYVNANKFQTQFVDSIKNNNRNDFLHFYQMIDILIIDDIHELAGKEKTQDTFFHIFNHLHQTGKQLVLTSDKPPVELQGIEQRLISRFKWGLAADLQKPDYNTRMAILQQKSYHEGIHMEKGVLEYIASCITNNIREMEGALISLLAQSTLNKKEITLDLTKTTIEKLVKHTQKEITIDDIQKKVCGYYNITLESLQSKSRKRQIVQARQIAMYFSKVLTNSSLSTIGAKIGRRDHATVLHACKTVQNLADIDKEFKGQLEEIERKLKN